jgi:hypothetical protein
MEFVSSGLSLGLLIARFFPPSREAVAMFPRLEKFLAVFAVTAIAVTAAFWAFPPELRFPDPRPEAGVSSASPVEAPVEAPIEAAPAPASALAPQNETPAPIVSNDSDEMWRRLPATLSLAIREKLPDASLSDEDIRELTETIRTFRESMQSLREVERTPENADRIRELMGRVEEDRRQFEKTTGMSIAEFVQRTTTSGIDNGKPEEGKVVLETLDGPGR